MVTNCEPETAGGVALRLEQDRVPIQDEIEDLGPGSSTSDIAHDLYHGLTLLAARVRGVCSMWAHGRKEDFGIELLLVERDVEALQILVEDLRSSRGRALSPAPMSLIEVDVGATARQLAERFAPMAWSTRRLEIQTDLSAVDPALGNREDLQKALSNLIVNAVRYTPPGGLVRVGVQQLGSWVQRQVEDTGAGFAPEELERIWDRGYRAPGPGREAGTGLGLSIVRRLVERMGGTVAVESTVSVGSTFSIKLRAAGRPKAA